MDFTNGLAFHELEFLSRVRGLTIYQYISKWVTANNDNPRTFFTCYTRLGRTMIHIECKRRRMYSVRTASYIPKALCSKCHILVTFKYVSGNAYPVHSKDCNHAGGAYIGYSHTYAHSGVIVSSNYPLFPTDGIPARRRMRHYRNLLIATVLRPLPKDIRWHILIHYLSEYESILLISKEFSYM
jgi:hypothetical protein